MRTRTLMVLVVLILPLTGLILPSISGEAGDVSESTDFVQMYAPAKIQVQFIFTIHRDIDCRPYGFSTHQICDKGGTEKLYFEAIDNDTYYLLFTVFYDLPVTQNVTITTQEGSRSPISRKVPMISGKTIFIEFKVIQVVPEPRSATKEELGNYLGQVFIDLGKTNQAAIGTLTSVVVVLIAAVIFSWILTLLAIRRLGGLSKFLRAG